MSSEERYSASQCSAWLECERKWGWRYIAKIELPPQPSAALGSLIHGELENYLKGKGFDSTLGVMEICLSGVGHLPAPHSDACTEQYFRYQGRHLWIGYKDLETHDAVYDHKSTSDLKYAKNPGQLFYDPQAILYALEFCDRRAADSVWLHWVYYQTKGAKKSRKVSLQMHRAHAVTVFAEMERVADEIKKAREPLEGLSPRDHVLSLKANPDACESYGGCPYRGLCNLSPQERMRSVMSNVNAVSDLFSRLQKQTVEAPVVDAINAPERAPLEATRTLSTQGPPNAVVAIPAGVSGRGEGRVINVNGGAASTVGGSSVSFPVIPTSDKEWSLTPTESKALQDMPNGTVLVGEPVVVVPDTATSPKKEEPLTLLIDCVPVNPGQKFRHAEDYFEEAKRRIHAQHGLADYRFKEFGQGKGIFLATVTQVFDEDPCTTLCLSLGTDEASICFSYFLGKAGFVMRGVK